MIRIAIFASGRGSNAKRIIEHLQKHPSIKVGLVISNKSTAPVLEMAESYGIPSKVLNRKDFYDEKTTSELLSSFNISFIALAGFLWLIPPFLVKRYEGKMVNLHPSLLPKFGGKGMYGMNVHIAVKAAEEKETGITIHYVNEHFDEGKIIFQARCQVDVTDSPEDIAKKIHALEHEHFPLVIEETILKTIIIQN